MSRVACPAQPGPLGMIVFKIFGGSARPVQPGPLGMIVFKIFGGFEKF